MSEYEYDLFVSYRRSDDDWIRWTEENFIRALACLLRPSVGDVRIFFDKEIEVGSSWPTSLARKLARSRILVPVLSRGYFQSEWCRLELALMLYREKLCGCRTRHNTGGLIFPVIIDDGDKFPAEIQEIQSTRIHAFANPFMRPDSPKQEDFADLLRRNFCHSVEAALTAVPPLNPDWESFHYDKFKSTFIIATPTQRTLPSLTFQMP